jgi:RHS repeat-associated protein
MPEGQFSGNGLMQAAPSARRRRLRPRGYILNLRFPGQYFDAESGLNYNVNRDYEPSTGRYLQSDPIGLSGGSSTYAYVLSAPLDAIDSLGLQSSPQLCAQNPGWAEACEAAGMLPKPKQLPLPSPAQMGGAAAAAAAGGLAGEAAPGAVAKPAIPDCEGGDLCEQLALAEAKAGAGMPIPMRYPLGDLPRLVALYGPGEWVKMQHTHRCPDGRLVTIHYFSNGAGLNVELKITSGGIGV